MTEISEAAREKARELVGSNVGLGMSIIEVFAHFIQQVSDAAKDLSGPDTGSRSCAYINKVVAPFILPEPVTVRGQIEAIFADGFDVWKSDIAEKLLKELPKRGLKIVEAA